MAHKKGQGSTNNGRESQSKRLGVKLFGGQTAIPGNIIVRQRGTRFHPGAGVGMGKDHTIFAKEVGLVTFTTTKNNRKYIHVLPEEGTVVAKPAKKAAKAKTETPKTEAPKTEKKAAAKAPEAKVEAPKEVKETKAVKKESAPKAAPAKKAKASAKGDDLKKISGVGPAFEKRLNALGIFTYADMIALTDAKIDELEAKDAMTSMEQWHDWMKQAKELKG